MKDPHDDKLEQSGHWPLRGTFTIELLNQLNDSNHYRHFIQFHHHFCSKCTNRVVKGVMTKGLITSQFISHDTLLLHSNNAYNKNDSLIFRISYEDTEPPYQVAPVTFKITKFSQWLERWHSGPFFTFKEGYQMRLVVYGDGSDTGKGTHISLFLHLMKGPHDDKLEQSSHWPLRGTFTIEILNQLNNSDHFSSFIQFHHHICSKCTNRVLEGVAAKSTYGIAQFISHDTVLHHNNNAYSKNDTVIFRVTYEDTEPPYQVAPVTFKVTKFTQWLKNKRSWYSSPFFAFEGGYQMCLKVDVGGYGDGEGTHVSATLHLMKGPHDDKLEESGDWPLKGTFTIQLLNQLNDSDYYSDKATFMTYLCSNCASRVEENDMAIGWVIQLISHDTLLHHSNSGYVKDDTLYFRVIYEECEWIDIQVGLVVVLIFFMYLLLLLCFSCCRGYCCRCYLVSLWLGICIAIMCTAIEQFTLNS